MSKRINRKSDSPLFAKFMAFWTTVPGILTGIAAVITAIAALYLAFGNPKNSNDNVRLSANPSVSPTQKSSSPTPVNNPDSCFGQEFLGSDPIELGSGAQPLRSKDGAIKIKLTDKRQPIGALDLRFYSDGQYFEIEKVVDSNCNAVEDLFNLSRQMYVDIKKNKIPNYDYLQVPLMGQNYSLRLMSEGNTIDAVFEKR